MNAPMLNWMSEKAVAAEAGRAGASTSSSKSAAWESRKAVAAPLLRADRRLRAAPLSVSASIAMSFPLAQQNVVSARRVVHVPLLVKYSWAVSAVSPAGQPDGLETGSTSTEE